MNSTNSINAEKFANEVASLVARIELRIAQCRLNRVGTSIFDKLTKDQRVPKVKTVEKLAKFQSSKMAQTKWLNATQKTMAFRAWCWFRR